METWVWRGGLSAAEGESAVGLAPVIRPTARSLADLRASGDTAAEVERWNPRARFRQAPRKGYGGWLVILAMIALASLLVAGCATGGRPPAMELRDAYVTYLIPKDPLLANLRGSRAPRLSLPAYDLPAKDETVTGISNSFRPDGLLLVNRFTLAPKKGRRSEVEYRVQQETIDRGDGYAVTLRPESVRAYGGIPLFDPPLPEFTAEDLLRHLASARFSYQMDIDSTYGPEQLCAIILRRTVHVSMPPGEDASVPGGRSRSWFSIQYGEVDVRFSFNAVPSATGSRATFRLIVPSYFTAPHTVNLAQILAELREHLVRIANEEKELTRPGAEAGEARQGRGDSSSLDRREQ